MTVKKLVQEQEKDVGLFCEPKTIVEEHLQTALIALHNAVKNEGKK